MSLKPREDSVLALMKTLEIATPKVVLVISFSFLVMSYKHAHSVPKVELTHQISNLIETLIFSSVCTAISRSNGTLAILWSKMASFQWP